MHHDALIPAGELLFVIGVHRHHKEKAVEPHGRLNGEGDVFLIGFRIEIGKVFPRIFHVALQIVVGAVGDAEDFAPADAREVVFDVGRGFGVEGKLRRLMVAVAEVPVLHAEGIDEFAAVFLPIGEPLQVGARLAEELHLELLEFAGAEREVPRGDFVAEAFPGIADAEGNLLPAGALDVFEVDEDALSRLRAEVDGAGGILRDPNVGLEHHVEFADGGEIALPANGADHLVGLHELVHLFEVHPIDVDVRVFLLDELIGAVAGFAGFAVDHRVVEGGDVTRRLPNLRVHEDRGVQADVRRGFLDEFLPPHRADVPFHLHPKGTIVPRIGQPAVNLRALENITRGLEVLGDGFEADCVGHFLT